MDTVKTQSNGGSTSYYQLPEGATELLDLIEAKGMNFAIGNIFKAAYRLGSKEGVDRAYDLRKIIFFAERELARIEPDVRPDPPTSETVPTRWCGTCVYNELPLDKDPCADCFSPDFKHWSPA